MEELAIVTPEVNHLTLSYALSKVDGLIEPGPGQDLTGIRILISRPGNHVAILKDGSPAVRTLDHLTSATILDLVEAFTRLDPNENTGMVVLVATDFAASVKALQVDEVVVLVVVDELLTVVADSHGCFLSLAIL
jgi:hypothetical protein